LWLLAATAALTVAVAPTASSAAVLYDQTDHQGADGFGSNAFAADPAFSDQIADDFVVPPGQHWALSEVDVFGFSTGPTIPSVNVFLYANAGTLPGTQLFAQNNIAAPGGANFTIPLTGAPTLDPGTYWVSAQANAPSGSQWSWYDRTPQSGNPAAYRQPGGTGCTSWTARTTCFNADLTAPDQLFKLLGTFRQVLGIDKAGAGSGTVMSSPGGIDCGATCSSQFDAGSSVTLTASPAAGSTFAGWSGGGCSGTASCQLTLNGDQTVTATFAGTALTVTKGGSGSGTVTSVPAGIDCGTTCSGQFVPGAAVTLTATADSGASFAGWGGACAGTDPCRLTMSADHDVSATFSANRPPGNPPNTKITKAKINSKAGKATFKFKAVGTASTFQCALKKPAKHRKASKLRFKSCKSPKTYKHLEPGKYTFEVRAVSAAGRDPSPAKKKFKIG
jgi:hypothetical protein